MHKTVKSEIKFSGIGLHTGKMVNVTISPYEAVGGISFVRTDENSYIDANWKNVYSTTMNTRLSNDGGVTISTIEHLMAALSFCGITKCLVEVDGPEIPIMDGSSAVFYNLLKDEVKELSIPQKQIKIIRDIMVGDDDKWVMLRPADQFSSSIKIKYNNNIIGEQEYSFDFSKISDIVKSRTFCLEQEIDYLKQNGLALGGSLDNAIVVTRDGNRVHNDFLYYDDEFARHKTIDLIGDLYLAEMPIIGHFSGYCSGHALNNKLLRKLFSDKNNYRIE